MCRIPRHRRDASGMRDIPARRPKPEQGSGQGSRAHGCRPRTGDPRDRNTCAIPWYIGMSPHAPVRARAPLPPVLPMRSHRLATIGALALFLGACSRGSNNAASLPEDLQKDLAAVATTSDFAPASATGPRLSVVSGIERGQSSTPARSPKVAKRAVPPTHHRPTRTAPARTATPTTVAAADEPAPASSAPAQASPEVAPTPAPQPAPSGAQGTEGNGRGTETGRGGRGQGGGGGGGGIGGILGGILGGVVMGGQGGYGHGHHRGHGDGDHDGDRHERGMGLPLAPSQSLASGQR
jgi:hypothetical protein